MPTFTSIFSILKTNSTSIKLWHKLSHAEHLASNNSNNNINFLSAYKKSSPQKTIANRFFRVEEGKLFCFDKHGTSVKGVLSLEFCHIEVEPSTLPSTQFTLRVVKNEKYTEVYIKDR